MNIKEILRKTLLKKPLILVNYTASEIKKYYSFKEGETIMNGDKLTAEKAIAILDHIKKT